MLDSRVSIRKSFHKLIESEIDYILKDQYYLLWQILAYLDSQFLILSFSEVLTRPFWFAEGPIWRLVLCLLFLQIL